MEDDGGELMERSSYLKLLEIVDGNIIQVVCWMFGVIVTYYISFKIHANITYVFNLIFLETKRERHLAMMLPLFHPQREVKGKNMYGHGF